MTRRLLPLLLQALGLVPLALFDALMIWRMT